MSCYPSQFKEDTCEPSTRGQEVTRNKLSTKIGRPHEIWTAIVRQIGQPLCTECGEVRYHLLHSTESDVARPIGLYWRQASIRDGGSSASFLATSVPFCSDMKNIVPLKLVNFSTFNGMDEISFWNHNSSWIWGFPICASWYLVAREPQKVHRSLECTISVGTVGT